MNAKALCGKADIGAAGADTPEGVVGQGIQAGRLISARPTEKRAARVDVALTASMLPGLGSRRSIQPTGRNPAPMVPEVCRAMLHGVTAFSERRSLSREVRPAHQHKRPNIIRSAGASIATSGGLL